MQKEVNPVVVIAAIVVIVAGIVGALIYLSSPHTPPGVKYTPGVPPWKNGGAYQPWQGVKLPQGQAPAANSAVPPTAPASSSNASSSK